MKELSIEEKAKAFDAFLTRLYDAFMRRCNDWFDEDMKEMYYRLKESEDEEIRTKLLNLLKELLELGGVAQDTWSKNDCEQFIDWLKNQGEQKPNFCHHEVDLSNCSEEYRKAYYDGWNNCNMQHSQLNSELDDVVKCLINGMKFYYESNEEATWGTDKWSMPVKHIIEVLEAQVSQNFANSARTCKDEQKTCKDEQKTCKDEQNRWKPTELQLECLDDAIKHYQSNGSRPVILVELLEDLKKLKEGKL